jgi:hypothetical protein
VIGGPNGPERVVDAITSRVPVEQPPKVKVWWVHEPDGDGDRLYVQSLDDREFTLTDLVINKKRECTLIDTQSNDPQIRKEATAKLNPYMAALLKLTPMGLVPPPPWKFTLGDIHSTFWMCDPVKIDIETDLGSESFHARNK